ncbi:MAG: hypothetical protein WCD04_18700 [Terriglobia bacterium]
MQGSEDQRLTSGILHVVSHGPQPERNSDVRTGGRTEQVWDYMPRI